MGVYPGHPNNGGIEEFEQLEAMLGCSIPFMVQFGDGSNAQSFQSNLRGQFAADRLGRWAGEAPFRLVYGVPLAFGDAHDGSDESARAIARQWELLVGGDPARTQLYVDAATTLVEAGFGDAILRVGWEFDGVTSRWYAGVDPELFQDAFRVVVDLFRSVSPEFRIDYNFLVSADPDMLDRAYPGDEYVDIVGLDIYDKGYTGPGGVSFGDEVGWSDPQRVWDSFHVQRLLTHLDVARRHDKPVSFPEWALAGGSNAGGDNPVFIQNMYAWIEQLDRAEGPGVVYHGYFDTRGRGDGPHDLATYPESRASFIDLFGR